MDVATRARTRQSLTCLAPSFECYSGNYLPGGTFCQNNFHIHSRFVRFAVDFVSNFFECVCVAILVAELAA